MDFILKVILAYLLGSVVGSLVVGRLRGGVDIRKLGSGNAGSTNALRTQGLAFGIWVVIIDVAKGWIAAALLPRLAIPGVEAGSTELAAWLPASCGFAAILGHVFPVWHGFRGGKGVATLVGAYAGLDIVLLAPLVLSWLAVVTVSGYVGLASITASIAMPIYLLVRDGAHVTPQFGFALACAVLVVWTHRGNIQRMRAGSESRARKLWLFGRGRT
ncbi:MAG TPA: glycerol-3-phosphate 1-O-acyltransferase PlsY [Steroidobacteraceae bacterium]|jgi:glycerol-3-phosphate acyltransferase PlsY|nr:glycerol-3-phosphate 1-O-acyltransferase PlsY [Steroidobacteraceae bacterium]